MLGRLLVLDLLQLLGRGTDRLLGQLGELLLEGCLIGLGLLLCLGRFLGRRRIVGRRRRRGCERRRPARFLGRLVGLLAAPGLCLLQGRLAGALGLPTLLFSNSSEYFWRKLPGTMTDAWHRSATHIEAESLGDKTALVRALTAALSRRFPI